MSDQSALVLNYNPTHHILAFIDALGFSRASEHSEVHVKKYFEAVDRARNNWKNLNKEKAGLIRMTTVGDAVILAIKVPLKKETNLPEHFLFVKRLSWLCEFTAFLQARLAFDDIWVRGAITYGPLHFKKQRIVGSAFHRAYFLEENVAKYPRIILDGGVIKASGCATCSDLIERPVMRSLLYNLVNEAYLPRDVPTFIDFALKPGHLSVDVEWVKTVSQHVSKRLKEDVEHYIKYRWVADYLSSHLHGFPQGLAEEINEYFRLLQGN